MEESEAVGWELNTVRVRERGEQEWYWNTGGEDVGERMRKAELVQTSGVDKGCQRRALSYKTKILTLIFSCRESGQNTYAVQSCPSDSEAKPQAREGEELKPAVSRQCEGLCY